MDPNVPALYCMHVLFTVRLHIYLISMILFLFDLSVINLRSVYQSLVLILQNASIVCCTRNMVKTSRGILVDVSQRCCNTASMGSLRQHQHTFQLHTDYTLFKHSCTFTAFSYVNWYHSGYFYVQ